MTEHIISHPKNVDLRPGCFKPREDGLGCLKRDTCSFPEDCSVSGLPVQVREGRFTDNAKFKRGV